MDLLIGLAVIVATSVGGAAAVMAHRRASANRMAEALAMTDAALEERVFWLNQDEIYASEYHDEAERRAAAKKVLDRAA